MKIEIERRKTVGGWEKFMNCPGVLVYGASEAEARIKVIALALRVIADRIEAGEAVPLDPADFFVAA